MGPRFRITLRLLLLILCCTVFPSLLNAQSAPVASASPSQTIDLAAHGFSSTSAWQETFADDLGVEPYASQIAMEFLDEQHLLVAFSGTDW